MLTTIAQAFDGRDNNFNLLRMIAASSVLFSHSWSLAFTEEKGEPLAAFFVLFTLGGLAVTLFFVLSGFLIARSFENRKSTIEFAIARVCRLYPGLLLALSFCVLIVGPLCTTMPIFEYFSNRKTWTFIPAGLSLFQLRYDLPGVFENNPYKGGVDGSLWTLYYEVFCYISVAVVGFLGFLATRAFTATLIVYFAVYTALRVHLGDSGSWGYTELTLPFALGVAIYVYRACVPLSAIMLGLLILSVILLRQTELYREAVVFTVAYGTFWAGLLKFPFIHHYNRMGDYSYGMYIFAFPIQQVLAMMMPGIAPWQMIAIAWPTTLVLAVLSWHLIENPVLMKRHVIGEFLNRRIRQVFTGNRHFRNSPPHLN